MSRGYQAYKDIDPIKKGLMLLSSLNVRYITPERIFARISPPCTYAITSMTYLFT